MGFKSLVRWDEYKQFRKLKNTTDIEELSYEHAKDVVCKYPELRC
jgi:hypothetical protein